jgi:ATP-dependent Clp protease ATP-binding subunit ClpB
MTPDRFTIKTQEALQAAQRLADERGNPQVVPEHLLAVLLEQDAGVVLPVLQKLGASPDRIRADVNAALDALPTVSGATEPAGFSGDVAQILRAAE